MARPSIRRGHSVATDAAMAAREFFQAVSQPRMSLVVFFCSTAYDLDSLAAELRRLFGQTHVIGCTTAGEIGPDGYTDGSLTGFSLDNDACCAVSELIPAFSDFQMGSGYAAADRALAGLARLSGAAIDPVHTFAVLLSDGMSTNEEALLASIHRRMHNIPLLGGSAGDDFCLKQTFVYHAGRFHPDAALLTLLRLTSPFRLYRCQHYAGSDVKLVVTQADPARRVVSEINAEPAAREYARIAGVDPATLTPTLFAEAPLMVRVGGNYYVRSIQKVNEDGSLTFFCAIDEGVVLTLARREDMLENLKSFFRQIHADMGPPGLVLGFDCILRSLEAEKSQNKHLVSRVLADNNVIGFSTYGEQFGAMHVNQTFTAVAFGTSREA